MLSTKDQEEIYRTPKLKVLNEKQSTYTLKDLF